MNALGWIRSIRPLGGLISSLPSRFRRRAGFLRVTALPALLLAAAACSDDDPIAPNAAEDIIGVVASTSDVSTLQAAVEAAGLVPALQTEGPFTVFAPRNGAFEALGADVVAALLDEGNIDLLTDILSFHVVAGVAARSTDLSDGQKVTTLQGEQLTIGISGSTVTVGGATVVQADVEASNGVIHIIDAVLVPSVDVVEKAILTGETQTLVAALGAGDLVGILQGVGPFTVFAPVNSAFAALGADKLDVLLDPANLALLQKVLTYHVVYDEIRSEDLVDGATLATVEGTELTFDLSGASPKVNGADILVADIVVENGVIHLIDEVLANNLDLVDVALLNGFPTLVDLVSEAGLEATLRSDNGGQGFTVFAPTEAAFAALASVPSGQDLIDVLTYHVVSGTVPSGSLSDAQDVATVQGGSFTVNIDGASVTLTDATDNTVGVVLTDVPAANGVVHVIDGVILP